MSIQEKLIRMGELITELETCNDVNSKPYQLIEESKGRYFLIRLSDKKIVSDGTIERINSYCNLRNIKKNNISL